MSEQPTQWRTVVSASLKTNYLGLKKGQEVLLSRPLPPFSPFVLTSAHVVLNQNINEESTWENAGIPLQQLENFAALVLNGEPSETPDNDLSRCYGALIYTQEAALQEVADMEKRQKREIEEEAKKIQQEAPKSTPEAASLTPLPPVSLYLIAAEVPNNPPKMGIYGDTVPVVLGNMNWMNNTIEIFGNNKKHNSYEKGSSVYWGASWIGIEKVDNIKIIEVTDDHKLLSTERFSLDRVQGAVKRVNEHRNIVLQKIAKAEENYSLAVAAIMIKTVDSIEEGTIVFIEELHSDSETVMTRHCRIFKQEDKDDVKWFGKPLSLLALKNFHAEEAATNKAVLDSGVKRHGQASAASLINDIKARRKALKKANKKAAQASAEGKETT